MSAVAQRPLHGRGLFGVAATLVLAAFSAVAGLAVAANLLVARRGWGGGQAVADIPPDSLVLYRSAASRYELGADGWSVLAAVGKVECDHGRAPDVGCGRGERNSAGAAGPAQFLAGTWASYGVD